jgi:hypothetical protein
MPRYMLSIIQPDGEPPPPEFLEPIMADLAVLNADMREKGVWVFAAGLHPPETATVLQFKDGRDGELSMTDGPFVEAKEHIGGFTIIEAEDLDAALKWGKRLASTLSPLWIEVRPLHHDSRTEGG